MQTLASLVFGVLGGRVQRHVLLYGGTVDAHRHIICVHLLIIQAVLAAGTLWFGLANSIALFFVARAVQGIGAAAMATSSLAMLTDHFPPEQISAAVGVNEACTGIGFMVTDGLSVCYLVSNYISQDWGRLYLWYQRCDDGISDM